MSRATPLPSDLRRQAIIDAALPLLLERGPNISTRAIARACGIAEGTLFRVFETKQELIHATIHAALHPDAAVARLASLPDTQSIDERAAAILEIVSAEITRIKSLFALVATPHEPHASGGAQPASHEPHQPHRHGGPPPHVVENRELLTRAVRTALEAYESDLDVPVDHAAQLLMALAFATRFSFVQDAPVARAQNLAHMALHGIAKPAARHSGEPA